MPFEIERKFLLRSTGWLPLVIERRQLRQAYFSSEGQASVRIRIADDSSATLTVKSRASDNRLEFEYPVPVADAIAMFQLREGAIISKVRHIVPAGELAWEIDVFDGDNAGLVIAEVELPGQRHDLQLPAWIGAEVTKDERYYNSSLARQPFPLWRSGLQVFP